MQPPLKTLYYRNKSLALGERVRGHQGNASTTLQSLLVSSTILEAHLSTKTAKYREMMKWAATRLCYRSSTDMFWSEQAHLSYQAASHENRHGTHLTWPGLELLGCVSWSITRCHCSVDTLPSTMFVENDHYTARAEDLQSQLC